MKNLQKRSRSFTPLIIAATIIVLGVAGWITLTVLQAQTRSQKDGNYFRNKYQTADGSDKCMKEYYDINPEAKPENQKPDTIYLAPPCPGVAQ